jgi:SAM-dependent methyltransferase
MTTTDRDAGLREELDFWRTELTGQGHFSTHIEARLEPSRRHAEHPHWLDQHLAQRQLHFGDEPVSLLDVGSGPISTLAWLAEQPGYLVTASDPLAEQYNELLDELGIDYPLRPLPASAEQLVTAFVPASFQAVHSRNALDHAEDIGLAAKELHDILVPGGFLFLEVFAHEGARQGYDGLHRFDFFARDGQLVCQDVRGAELSAFEAASLQLVWLSPRDSSAFTPGMVPESVCAIFQR